MADKFRVESWDDIKSNNFKILVSQKRKKEIFSKIGYKILDSGDLVDKDTGKKVVGMDNKVLNLVESPNLAFISGSHNFVRNIAEYSDLLAQKGDLKFVIDKDLPVKE